MIKHQHIRNELREHILKWNRRLKTSLLVALTMTLTLTTTCYSANNLDIVYTSQNETSLTQAVYYAVQAMLPMFENSMDYARLQLKDIIDEKGYDYGLTIESFNENGNPYKDCDLNELVTLCTLINSENAGYIGAINLVVMDVSEKEYVEVTPVKIDNYVEKEPGIYVKDGCRYIFETEKVPLYKEISNTDNETLYEQAGDLEIVPNVDTLTYGDVKLRVASADEIIAQTSLNFNSETIQAKYEDMLRVIQNGGPELKALQESILIDWAQYDRILSETEKEFVSNLPYEENENRRRLRDVALSLIGSVPYLWGGKSEKPGYDDSWWTYNKEGKQKGLDCSGYVQWIFRTSGYPKKTWDGLLSTQSILKNCERIDESELKVGDLGLKHEHDGTINHVGMYVGGGYFIHCSSSANSVTLTKAEKMNFHVFVRVDGVEDSKLKNMDAFKVDYIDTEVSKYTDDEIYLLSQLVAHEAAGEGLNGWIAVTEVVLNRINSQLFPDTMYDVIYQPGQFSYNNEIQYMEPSEDLIKTVKKVVSGKLKILNNEDVLFFRNPFILGTGGKDGCDDWGDHKFYMIINHHVFYLK